MVRNEYRGPSDKDGHGLFDGGEPYGSELASANWLVMPAADAAAPADSYAAEIGLAYLNEMAFLQNPQASTLSAPFRSPPKCASGSNNSAGSNATDPDLSAFAANGGKLIIYHSWADQAIPPFASINYYRAVVGQSGGLPAAQSFSRLCMVPGLYHCPCGQPVDGDPQRPCSSCLSSSPGSNAEKPRARSPCRSPRRPQGRMRPLSASILSTPCSRRRTIMG